MMRWQWRLALFWLAPAYRFRVLRAALNYEQFDADLRALFRAPPAIRHHWPSLLSLGMVMMMVDTPLRVMWFGLSTLLFVAMLLARMLIGWRFG